MSANRSLRTLKFQRTNSNVRNTISLTTPSTLSSTYNLNLPGSLPTTTQALLSDTSGTLSWGSISSAATQSTFSGANNVTTPSAVTGLIVSNSPTTIPVYVYVNATASLAALFTLNIFASTTGGYTLEDDSVGDSTGIKFSVDATGQVYYISGNYAGFTALTFKWYSPYTPVSSATSSLSLNNSLSVGTTTSLATNAINGSPSATNGNLVFISGSTFTDTSTAASGTAATFNATYIAAPTLKAINTSVTTTNASTLTIAGPPVASTNETITNTYAINVVSGNINCGPGNILTGNIIAPSGGLKITNNLVPCYAKVLGAATSFSIANAQTLILPTIATGSSGVQYSTSTGLATIQTTGLYEVTLLICFMSAVASFFNPLVNGTDVSPQQGRVAQMNTAAASITGTNFYNLTSGQTFGLQYAGNTVTVAGNPQDTFWIIRKVA